MQQNLQNPFPAGNFRKYNIKHTVNKRILCSQDLSYQQEYTIYALKPEVGTTCLSCLVVGNSNLNHTSRFYPEYVVFCIYRNSICIILLSVKKSSIKYNYIINGALKLTPYLEQYKHVCVCGEGVVPPIISEYLYFVGYKFSYTVHCIKFKKKIQIQN